MEIIYEKPSIEGRTKRIEVRPVCSLRRERKEGRQ